jgi:hypothetical protein
MTQIDEMPMDVAGACFCIIYRRDAFVLYIVTALQCIDYGCNPLLTMIVITKKMLMTAFVTAKMLMMAANVINMTMPAFVNDCCNPLLMMFVIVVKMYF